MHSEFRKTRSPYGFPFLDPTITQDFFTKTEKIKQILVKEGYQGVIPATLDFPETFQEYESFDAFHVRDSRGEDLYLRSDATAQIIKGFTNFLEHTDHAEKEYRFYYMLPVFRDARKSYPKLREIYQLGVENLGMDSPKAIMQLIRLANDVIVNLLDEPIEIVLGDVRIFQYIHKTISHGDIREMIQYRDVPSLTNIFLELGWSESSAKNVWNLLLYATEYDEWKSAWVKLKGNLNNSLQSSFMDEIERLIIPAQTMTQQLKKSGISISWQPLLIRKVDYYTGLIFEGYSKGLSVAPLRGGTYDNLVGKYSKRDMTASGFALDLSSLLI